MTISNNACSLAEKMPRESLTDLTNGSFRKPGFSPQELGTKSGIWKDTFLYYLFNIAFDEERYPPGN